MLEKEASARTGPQGEEESAPRLGDYELLGELARGGMGRVLLAKRVGQLGFERLCAIKLLHDGMQDEPEAMTMLVDEANIASRLHHPNVVPITDIGTCGDDGLYLVMEYVHGPSLYHLLRAYPKERPPRVVIPILLDALRGLHAAHELTNPDGTSANLVHRDFTPQNLLVGLSGACRVTDFGIAKVSARLTHTRAGINKGRLAYMAPEQMAAARDVDRRVDVWSAGVVLFYSLTGEHPFSGESEGDTIINIIRRDVPKLSSVGLCPPSCLDVICERALDRERSARYSTALEMADELHSIASDNGLLGTPSEVAEWVSAPFAKRLTDRFDAIRALTAGAVPETLHRLAPESATSSSSLSGLKNPSPVRDASPSLSSLDDDWGADDDGPPEPLASASVAGDGVPDPVEWSGDGGALASEEPAPEAKEPPEPNTPAEMEPEIPVVIAAMEEPPLSPVMAPVPQPGSRRWAIVAIPLALVVVAFGAVAGFYSRPSRSGGSPPLVDQAGAADPDGAAHEISNAGEASASPSSDAATASSDGSVAPAAAPDSAVAQVRITLAGVPDEARVRVDGRVVEEHTFLVAVDGMEHVVRVDHEGHRQWRHDFVPTEDATLDVELLPRREKRQKRTTSESVVRSPGF